MSKIKPAIEIAKNNLQKCYGKKGIFAGMHNFRDYWARDSCFASFGSLSIGDYEIVKINLSTFLDHLGMSWKLPKKIGKFKINIEDALQAPLKIGNSHFGIVMNYLGLKWDKYRGPYYINDKTNNKSVDQNALIVIAFHEYVDTSKDIKFLKGNINKLEKVMLWDFSCDIDNDFLMEEKPYCNWADSLKKEGKLLYTNICHCYALKCLSEMFGILNINDKKRKYNLLYKKTKQKIDEAFWNGEYYIDWIHKEKHANFSTDGNMLSILWRIASKEKAASIVNYSIKINIDKVPSECVYPLYDKKKMTATLIKFLGVTDYHNGLSWIWLGSVSAISKYRVGMKKEAMQILEDIADLIVKYGKVYEVYDKSGKPVKRLLYMAETPFAWSSGMFLYAVKEIILSKNKKKII